MLLVSQPEGVGLNRALTANHYVRALQLIGSINEHEGWMCLESLYIGGDCLLEFVTGQLLGTIVIPNEEEHGIPPFLAHPCLSAKCRDSCHCRRQEWRPWAA